MQNPCTPIGAHVQLKGGLATGGLAYTDAVAARAVQVFVGNPRGWRLTAGDPAQDALFRAGCAERGVPSFIHTPFLVNVGSPTEATVEQSIASIAHDLRPRRAARLRRAWSCTPGSAVGEDRYEAALRQLRERLLPVLDAAAGRRPAAADRADRRRRQGAGGHGGGPRAVLRGRSTATRWSASASTPATRGPPGTTWRCRAG